MISTPVFVNTPQQLQEAIASWQGKPWLTVDTEFLRVDTYRPKLCLVQVGDGENGYVIDAIAIHDLAPLFARLADTATLKIFHAAGQDLEIFSQLAGSCPAPLFDTQLAASLLGLGDQLGYAALVEKRLGVVLDKSLSRTDWSRRPLSTAELAYAAADVTCLAALYPPLAAELETRGRTAWLQEDAARACNIEQYTVQPEQAWQRLKGLARLDAKAQRIAARIAAWRETEAVAKNRPRGWIVEDEAVYRIAERRPATREALALLNVLPPKTLERHAQALLAAVALAEGDPATALAADERLGAEQKARLNRLREVVQAAAASHGVPAGLLAPRAELDALMQNGASASVRVLTGWRRAIVGEALLAVT